MVQSVADYAIPSLKNNFDSTPLAISIREYFPKAYQFIDTHPEEWRLDENVDLEVTNHVLRVRIQDNTIQNYVADVLAVCACQNSDGGWGTTRDDAESKVRATAFCVQMLLRANRVLKNPIVKNSVLKGLDYIIGNQQPDGSWQDPTWHFLDAASTSVGTLLFVPKEDFNQNKYKQTLDRGIQFIISQRHADGLWYYKPSGSPVTISAHLLQKCATYFGHSELHDMTIRALIKLQHPEGHWDDGNTDHTCDASRAMMLTASRSVTPGIIEEVFKSAYKAVDWLTQVSKQIGGGLGDHPGKAAHVERTCDGIDAMLKLREFGQNHASLIQFWS